jgi:hypothetical protein
LAVIPEVGSAGRYLYVKLNVSASRASAFQ